MDKKGKKPMKMFDFFNPKYPPIIIDDSLPVPSMLSPQKRDNMDKKGKKPMKMFDFFNPKSPPFIINDSPPVPSMLSSSCVSNVASIINDNNERKNGSQEEVLSPRLRLALNPFPTQASTNIEESFSTSVRIDGSSNQHQETAPTTLQGNKQKPVQSTSDETHTRVETKRSSRSVAPRKKKQPVPRHKEEEKDYSGISTELVLYEDPWKVKKKLAPSDLKNLSRLLLPRECLRIHVLQWMGAEMKTRVRSSKGMEVAVRDVDTGDEHRLVFRHWATSESYVLNGEWNKQFVKRRGLKTNDEIGMFWDTNACKFHFTVLRKAACGTSNADA